MITAEDRRKYPNHTDNSILGIKLIAGLRNVVLLEIIENEQESENYAAVRSLMGGNTNPNWILGNVVEEMWGREIISDETSYALQTKFS